MKIRDDIAELLRAGTPQIHICRQLHVAPITVQRTREALGMPAPRCGPPDTYASVEDAYHSNSETTDDGHKRWTGHTDTNGHPRLNFRQQRISVLQVAFRLHHGRDPKGQLSVGCDMTHCVEGAHLEDLEIREAKRRRPRGRRRGGRTVLSRRSSGVRRERLLHPTCRRRMDATSRLPRRGSRALLPNLGRRSDLVEGTRRVRAVLRPGGVLAVRARHGGRPDRKDARRGVRGDHGRAAEPAVPAGPNAGQAGPSGGVVRGPWGLGVCLHWIGAERQHCRSVDGVRAFLTGPRCPAHTPAALAGRPEAPETSVRPPSTLPLSPLSTSRVADARAIASGKRRSSPAAYREAQACVQKPN